MSPKRTRTAQARTNGTVRGEYAAAHATPRFDLTEEPWIPVLGRDGVAASMSLRGLLERSHELVDIAETEPLARAALRRWLTALTVLLVRGSSTGADIDAWTKAANINAGFTGDDIDAMLTTETDRLWLYHHATPFLQDRRLIDPLRSTAGFETSADDLVPQAPGDSGRAWAVKPTDPGHRGGLNEQQSAIALVRRWYYALLGNGGGGTKGGCYPDGTSNAPATQVFRVSTSSLFVTLLRNITVPLANSSAAPISGAAWHDPNLPTRDGDALYRYTLTASGALLGALETGKVNTILRSSIKKDKPTIDSVKRGAIGSDPHTMWAERPGVDQKRVRLYNIHPPLKIVEQLRRGIIEGKQTVARGVVNNSDLWLPSTSSRDDETIEILHATLAGSATSPQWDSTATLTMPAVHLDPRWDRSPDLDTLIDVAFGDGGINIRLGSAIRGVFAGAEDAKNRSMSGPLVAAARQRWLHVADRLTSEALAGHLSLVETESAMWSAAKRTTRRVLRPYAAQPRFAAGIITAINSISPPRKGKDSAE